MGRTFYRDFAMDNGTTCEVQFSMRHYPSFSEITGIYSSWKKSDETPVALSEAEQERFCTEACLCAWDYIE